MTLAKISRRSAVRRRAAWIAGAALAALAGLGTSGCSSGPGNVQSGESTGTTAEAVTVAGTSVLGFETAAGWTVSSGAVSLSTTAFTQGAAALTVAAPQNFTTLVSAPLTSGLAPLAGLTDQGATFEIDLKLPTVQPNPSYFGALQLFVSCPSRGVNNQYLGQSLLTGQPLGTFQTYKFAVTSFVQSQLKGATFSDLTFTVALNAPAGVTGAYVFDNLRVASAATAAVGAGTSINLVATTTPTAGTPGSANFTTGTIQIPASFHVAAGDAGKTGTALLSLGLGTTTTTSCTYTASSDATAYVFKSCSTSNVAGDLVAASSATLAIQSADPTAALTKIKAQLAYNALGDLVGTKLLPPMPTFWGTSLADINTIGNAFVNALQATPPASPAVSLPVPDYATRHGDGSPIDVSNGLPPPPGDPVIGPFQGHLNQGGFFDAYWTFSGNFVFPASTNDYKTTLATDQSVHVVLAGNDVNMVEVTAEADTDTGTVSSTGFVNPSASAKLGVFVIGIQVPNSPFVLNGAIPFNFPGFPLTQTKSVSVPVFNWIIFSVNVGASETLSLGAGGNLAFDGLTLNLTPHATASASVSANVNIGIASGGVSANIQLIDVSLPLTSSALWSFNSQPDVCQADITFDVNGRVQVSTLGGDVTAHASALFWSGSFTLFHWTGLSLLDKQIFDLTSGAQPAFPLPRSVCNVPLSVSISQPAANAGVLAGVPLPTSASAGRPRLPLPGQPAVLVPDPVDCSALTWTSSDPGVTFNPASPANPSQGTGCAPSVTFATPGAQTLTVTAVDKFGETGGPATVTVDVAAQVAGPNPQIVPPTPGPAAPGADNGLFQGVVTGGTGQVTATWTVSPTNVPFTNTQTVTAGTNVPLVPVAAPQLIPGNITITLTVTDSAGLTNSTSVTIFVPRPPP